MHSRSEHSILGDFAMLLRKFLLCITFIFSCAVFIPFAAAQNVVLTMDEVPNQLIDGLTVIKDGIGFTFTDPSGTFRYNSSGPGNLIYVNDPSIVGSHNPFTVSFSVPVYYISLGLAEISTSPVNGVQVELFNGGTLIDLYTLDLTLIDPIAEEFFNYKGPEFTSLRVLAGNGNGDLAIDNLGVASDFDTSIEIPEPGVFGLVMIALLGGIAGGRFRRTRLSQGSPESGKP
jgi:hypothetical protein